MCLPCKVRSAVYAMIQDAGVRGLWRGAGPTVQRATLLTASQAVYQFYTLRSLRSVHRMLV